MKSRLVLLAAIAVVLGAPAGAGLPRRPREPAPLAAYVRGRAAADLGALDLSAASFAAALAETPGDAALALRTMRQAVAAGDMPLALRTARLLDAGGSLPPDGTLLLLADAISAKDWARADGDADRVEREKLFAFLAPVLHAWIAAARHHPDPDALTAATQGNPLAASYAAEHVALLTLAFGKPDAGIAAFDALKLPDGARRARLGIAAAATLAQRGQRALAAGLLAGDDPAIVRARGTLVAGGRLGGAIRAAPAGIAELFARVSADIDRQQADTLALEFARLATLLAPDVSEGWLVSATLLARMGDDDAALAALARVAPGDPFSGAARDLRVTLLVRDDRADEALAEARAAADAPGNGSGDWARLGDLLIARSHDAEAARAYGTALDRAGGDRAQADLAWPLLLQQASAALQADDWPVARAAAARALALAPEQPAILNFIGYSELEHGGDKRAAAAMIAKASALAPDDASITDSLGWSWYVRGDLARAIPLLEQAARGAPAETDINDHLGDAYWRAGRRLEARYAWRAALIGADPAETTRIEAKIDLGPSSQL